LANKENARPMLNRTKEPLTPLEKTPLRLRRLSIENCSSVKTDKPVKAEDKSGAKSPSYIPRSRRLSLEGPRTIKKASADVNKTLQFEPMSQQKYRPQQDPEAMSKLNGQLSNGNSRSDLHVKPPSSPTNMYQKRLIKVDSGVQIHPLKLPQTPEPQLLDKNDSNRIVPSDLNDSITTKVVIGSTNGKGSQLRRSLRTIGKLINGPDKKYALLRGFKVLCFLTFFGVSSVLPNLLL
jgi:kinesin family protein C2/C3